MRRQDSYSQECMAKVILKDLKKVYPNTEKKKKAKKGEEPEKKSNLQITDEGVVAVQQFNLEIADKEFIVLVGPSGCGKSTTLRMIAGLEDITSGELWIGDKLMNDVEPKDRNIAMVFQNYALYPHMTVYENMAFSLKLKKAPKDEIDKKVREAAEILDITQYLDRKPKALSGGQRQRVAIGRAIVRDPAVFLMDEPLSNLDAKLRNQMRAEIIKLRQRIDTTFVYVTHDQTEAMTLGDRIVIMKDGFIQQIGTPQEVFDRPRQPVRGRLYRYAPDEPVRCAAHQAERQVRRDAGRHHRGAGRGQAGPPRRQGCGGAGRGAGCPPRPYHAVRRWRQGQGGCQRADGLVRTPAHLHQRP